MTKATKDEERNRKKLPFTGSDLQCRIKPRMNFAHVQFLRFHLDLKNEQDP